MKVLKNEDTVLLEHLGAQGGRSWQHFGEGKNDHKNFRQALFYYFRYKYVVFARNCKFAHLTLCNIQYSPFISALFFPNNTTK